MAAINPDTVEKIEMACAIVIVGAGLTLAGINIYEGLT